ncbi:MAG: nitroreductase family protein [Peptococcaceae bacterium]|nr:nitroreductase family protein [Peptococcaceae bacterium]
MELLTLMKTRRTIRKFTEEKVSEDQLEVILKAGLLAPSGRNLQPVEFFVTEDRAKILALEKCKDVGAGPLHEATLAIAIGGDREKTDIWIEDCSLAAMQMQLAVAALGLGSCWIHIRERKLGDRPADEVVREILDIPERFGIVCILAVGHKGEEKPAYGDEDPNFGRVHREKK